MKSSVMMWPKNEENKFNIYGGFLKQYLQCYDYYTDCKKRLRLPYVQRACSLSAAEYEVGTETESEPEERIRSASLIEKFPEDIFRTTQLIFSFEAGKIMSRLREPQHLYAMAQSMGTQNKALWPSELQVKIEYILHKQLPPAQPEPFYEQTGEEHIPTMKADSPDSHLVYQYNANINSFFSTSCRANKTYSKCCMNFNAVENNTLRFESRFESGNLAKAIQVGTYDYELYVHCDLYTQKHTQWYYFQVSNTRKGIPYRFTIVNFLKRDSLYNYGMKPLMYSEKAASDPLQPKGWQRIGNHIKYNRNKLRSEDYENEQTFFSLTWIFEFPYEEDTVYFAHCYPYTYTDLQTYLIECNNDPNKSKFYNQRILCKTRAGNNIYILTITNPCQNQGDGKPKRAVVMTARVHPGESNASWMMKGFLDYITGDSSYVEILRDNFVFKVVPMLNPDGVIVGNYRCSLSARDLNRNYKTILKDSFPSVWHVRNMVKKLLSKREVLIYCDLHGHSRKQNIFMYGCENNRNKNQSKSLHERIFPLLLSKNVPDKFKFESCKFKIHKNKEGTGRVIMWKMGILNSFTLEASFCGSTLGTKKGTHFNTDDYQSMGQHFCDTLLSYCDFDQSKFTNLSDELSDSLLLKWRQKDICTDNIVKEDGIFVSESSDAESDSSDSDESPVYVPAHQNSKKKKKLKTKTQRDKKLKASTLPENKTENEHTKQSKQSITRHKIQSNNQIQLPTQTAVERSSKASKAHPRKSTKNLTVNPKLSQYKQLSLLPQPATRMRNPYLPYEDDFGEKHLKNRINREYSVGIAEPKTKTLLEAYLCNLGVGSKAKMKIPETTSELLDRQEGKCFVETSTDFLAKAMNTSHRFSRPSGKDDEEEAKINYGWLSSGDSTECHLKDTL